MPGRTRRPDPANIIGGGLDRTGALERRAITERALRLGQLSDVKIQATPEDGAPLVYDATTGLWIPGTPTAGGAGGNWVEASFDTYPGALDGTGVTTYSVGGAPVGTTSLGGWAVEYGDGGDDIVVGSAIELHNDGIYSATVRVAASAAAGFTYVDALMVSNQVAPNQPVFLPVDRDRGDTGGVLNLCAVFPVVGGSGSIFDLELRAVTTDTSDWAVISLNAFFVCLLKF